MLLIRRYAKGSLLGFTRRAKDCLPQRKHERTETIPTGTSPLHHVLQGDLRFVGGEGKPIFSAGVEGGAWDQVPSCLAYFDLR